MSKSAAQEIVEYERDVSTALKQLYSRTRWEPAEEKTPLDALIATEESGSLEEWGIRADAIKQMFNYFLADGVRPSEVLGRVYAVGAHMAIPPFCNLTVRERALMLGDSHGAQHWRMQKVCCDVLRRKGARSWKAPGQKSLHSRKSNAAAQAGNSNRARKRKVKSRRKKKI
jgi:hypothetical protein